MRRTFVDYCVVSSTVGAIALALAGAAVLGSCSGGLPGMDIETGDIGYNPTGQKAGKGGTIINCNTPGACGDDGRGRGGTSNGVLKILVDGYGELPPVTIDCLRSRCSHQISACDNNSGCPMLLNCYLNKADSECEAEFVGRSNMRQCDRECPTGGPCRENCLSHQSATYARYIDFMNCAGKCGK